MEKKKMSAGLMAAMIVPSLLFLMGFGMMVKLMLQITELNTKLGEIESELPQSLQGDANKAFEEYMLSAKVKENRVYVVNPVRMDRDTTVVHYLASVLYFSATMVCLCLFIGFTFLIALTYYFNANIVNNLEYLATVTANKES